MTKVCERHPADAAVQGIGADAHGAMFAARRYHQATCVADTASDEVAASERPARPEAVRTYGAATSVPATASAAGRLLDAAIGITAVRRLPGGGIFRFRRYSSAGALYPLETYVVSGGYLYAFDALGRSLVPLAAVSSDALADAAAAPEIANAGATIVVTGVLARTAWKYGERGYRHLWWDAGTMFANVLALAAARSYRPRLYVAFIDHLLDELLGIDGINEFAVGLVSMNVPPLPDRIPGMPAKDSVSASADTRYPHSRHLHAASSLADRDDVGRWRADFGFDEPVLDAVLLERALAARRSIRRYDNVPLGRNVLEDLLNWSESQIPADAPSVIRQRVAIAQVAGLQPGIYASGLVRLVPYAADELRSAIGFAAMRQGHPHSAAVNVCQVADLYAVAAALGDRGYRWAQMEAGIRAGRLQLGASLHGLGAAAATFYDYELARVLGTADSPLLLVSLGAREAAATDGAKDNGNTLALDA